MATPLSPINVPFGEQIHSFFAEVIPSISFFIGDSGESGWETVALILSAKRSSWPLGWLVLSDGVVLTP